MIRATRPAYVAVRPGHPAIRSVGWASAFGCKQQARRKPRNFLGKEKTRVGVLEMHGKPKDSSGGSPSPQNACCLPASGVRGPGWDGFIPGPARTQTGKPWPSLTENGAPGSAPARSRSPVHGWDPLRQSVGFPSAAYCPLFHLSVGGVCSPDLAPFGPGLRHMVRTRKAAMSPIPPTVRDFP